MLIIKFVKLSNFVIWLKVIENYGRSVISNGYSFLYGLCFFALFFLYRLYCFIIRLTVIFIFGNWYICLIFSKVLCIFGCPCNGCLCIFRISCFYSSVGIYNLSFFYKYLLCFYICLCKVLLGYIIMLVRFFCWKWLFIVRLNMV